MAFSAAVLALDPQAEVTRIAAAIRTQLQSLRRRGIVLGLSGGIDSSVTAALAVEAVGAKRVFGLFMPEADSDPESLSLGELLATQLGIESVQQDVAPALAALGCYQLRNAAVGAVIPEFAADWKFKVVAPGSDHQGLSFLSVVARSPTGLEVRRRLPFAAYLEIIAATNYKQRVRKMVEYMHADRLNYAVAGTPNRLEYDQGFFVKQGDGAADLKPIAHLYKTQVYQLAQWLDIPAPIRSRAPTTDTYSLPQGQDEFYFGLPYDKLDLCLFGRNHGVAAREVASAAGLTEEQVLRAYADIDAKRASTRYGHLAPLLVEEIADVG
ncbi:MAG: NAD(+) synthase [Steroidobacteraceae bacterium]